MFPRPARRRLVAVARALACTSVALAAPLPIATKAHADEPAKTRADYDRLVDEALAEFDAGHFEEALALFEQANAARPSARAQRGMAKALFELRAYTRCLETIDAALASNVEPLTGSLRADLEALRERTLRFVGKLILDVSPRTAAVLVDGKTPQPLGDGSFVLDVGPHTIEANAPEHHPTRRTVEVHGGETARLVIQLELARVVLVDEGKQSSRTTAIALSAGAGALSLGGLLASSIWFVDRSDAVKRCNDAAHAGARCANADAIASQRDASLWAMGISGAAAIASGIVFVLVLKEPGRSGAMAAVSCGSSGLSAGLSFGCGAVRRW